MKGAPKVLVWLCAAAETLQGPRRMPMAKPWEEPSKCSASAGKELWQMLEKVSGSDLRWFPASKMFGVRDSLQSRAAEQLQLEDRSVTHSVSHRSKPKAVKKTVDHDVPGQNLNGLWKLWLAKVNHKWTFDSLIVPQKATCPFQCGRRLSNWYNEEF